MFVQEVFSDEELHCMIIFVQEVFSDEELLTMHCMIMFVQEVSLILASKYGGNSKKALQ